MRTRPSIVLSRRSVVFGRGCGPGPKARPAPALPRDCRGGPLLQPQVAVAPVRSEREPRGDGLSEEPHVSLPPFGDFTAAVSVNWT